MPATTLIDELAGQISAIRQALLPPVVEAQTSSTASIIPVVEHTTVRIEVQRLEDLLDRSGSLVGVRSRLMRRIDDLVGSDRIQQQTVARVARLAARLRAVHESAPVPMVTSATTTAVSVRGGSPVAGLDVYDEAALLVRDLEVAVAGLLDAQRLISDRLLDLHAEGETLGGAALQVQETAAQARLVPAGRFLARLHQTVAEAAGQAGVQADLHIDGTDVGVDQVLAERLTGALMHLVRNAIAHGIEPMDQRLRSGKSGRGRVVVGARQDGASIVITVGDDGRGLDLEALREAGVRRGLLPAETTLTDPRIPDLIFASGLTTRDHVDGLAGRGIGGDAVRRDVEALGGRVLVGTAAGRGTTITMQVPLTLAVARVLVLVVDGEHYALPVASAERVISLEDQPPQVITGTTVLAVDGDLLPLIRLADQLHHGSENVPLVGLVVRHGSSRSVLAVDAVAGQDDLVVKGLGPVATAVPWCAGSAIDGDGRIVLVINPLALLGGAESVSTSNGWRGSEIVGTFSAAPVPVPIADPESMVIMTTKVPVGSDLISRPQSTDIPTASAAEPAVAPAILHQVVPLLVNKTPPPMVPTPLVAVAPPVTTNPATLAGGITMPIPPTRTPIPEPAIEAKPVVLVVDDSLSVRRAMERFLIPTGCQVVAAADGVDALAVLEQQAVDVVFTDLEMPRLHGFDLLRRMRADARWQSLPVVVVSSRSGDRHQQLAADLGADGFLIKPFNDQALVAELARVRSGRRGAG